MEPVTVQPPEGGAPRRHHHHHRPPAASSHPHCGLCAAAYAGRQAAKAGWRYIRSLGRGLRKAACVVLVVAGAVFVVVALIVGTAIGLFVMATSFGRPYVDAFAMVRWSIGLLLLLLGWEALANAARNVPPPSPGAEDPTPPAT